MNFQGQVRSCPQSPHHAWPDRQIRYEVAIHHVYVNKVRTSAITVSHGASEVSEIGGENGR